MTSILSEGYIPLYVEINSGPRQALPKARTTGLRIGILNARRVHFKSAHIHDVITTEQLDILVVTETWLQVNCVL